MENQPDNLSKPQAIPAVDAREDDTVVTNASRRQFFRRSVLGGAVVVSLANRPAWAGWTQQECVSVGLLASVGANEARLASLTPAAQQQLKDTQDKIREWQQTVSDSDGAARLKNSNGTPPQVCLEFKD